MTPADLPASEGPIHTAATFLEARLAAIFPATRFHREVLPAPLTLQVMARFFTGRAPFVGHAFLGFRPQAGSGRQLQARLRWGVYLLARNQRPRARLLGDSQGPGLAQMVHAATVGLHGWTPPAGGDGGVGTLEVTEAETLDGANWAEADTAVAACTVETLATFPLAPDAALRSLVTSWSFPDDAAAAADTITLEGA